MKIFNVYFTDQNIKYNILMQAEDIEMVITNFKLLFKHLSQVDIYKIKFIKSCKR